MGFCIVPLGGKRVSSKCKKKVAGICWMKRKNMSHNTQMFNNSNTSFRSGFQTVVAGFGSCD